MKQPDILPLAEDEPGRDSPHFAAELATVAARFVIEKLLPFCERIELVGSLRRGRPRVHDVDLVLQPTLRTLPATLLDAAGAAGFEGPGASAGAEAARRLITAWGRLRAGGDRIIRGEVVLFKGMTSVPVPPPPVHAPLPLDLYLATEKTWATLLLIRTGSRMHNIWLCERARKLGMRLHAGGEGLTRVSEPDPVTRWTREEPVDCQEEADLYRLLGVPYLPPKARDVDFLQCKTWDPRKVEP